MPNFEVDGLNLYYEVHGSGPAVILTPGGRNDTNALRPLAALLSSKCQVILHDRVNCGRSDRLERTSINTARDLYGTTHMGGDYAKIAEGMGAVGIVVSQPSEIVGALNQAQQLNSEGKTVLIDVRSNLEARRSQF